jgi:hypothetical protein
MTNKKNCCCCNDREHIRVETLTLDDGRRAERHVTIDNNGNEVVEIFAEEKRPLKLEKRIVREFKNIVAKEIHQTVKDGEVAYEETLSLEPEVPLQVRQKIGLVDHAKVVDGDYVRKEEIDKLIADGVVAGVSALLEHMEPVSQQKAPAAPARPEPLFKAQEIVERNVEEKKKNDMTVNIIMGIIIIAQLAFFGYIFLM